MLHYALITRILRSEEEVVLSLLADTGEDIKITSNFVKECEKYEANTFYLIKTVLIP